MKNHFKSIYLFPFTIIVFTSYSMDREALIPLMEEGRAAQSSALRQAPAPTADRTSPSVIDKLIAARPGQDGVVRISGIHLLLEATQSSRGEVYPGHFKTAIELAEKPARLKALGDKIAETVEMSCKVSTFAVKYCVPPVCLVTAVFGSMLLVMFLGESHVPMNCQNMTSCNLLDKTVPDQTGTCHLPNYNITEFVNMVNVLCCLYDCSGNITMNVKY